MIRYYAFGSESFLAYPNLETDLSAKTKYHLPQFSAKYQIPATRQHLAEGNPAIEIHAMAEKLDADVMVIGSHGRSGLSLMFGSTANSVLHGSKCDVLAVRVGKN